MTTERTREAAAIMLAWAEGKSVEVCGRGDFKWSVSPRPVWNWDDWNYRIKPDSVYRPWTAEEVPLGAWIRSKQGPTRGFGHGIIIYADDGGVPMPCGIQNSWVGFHDLLNNFEHSTDNGKTWKPCGMEE